MNCSLTLLIDYNNYDGFFPATKMEWTDILMVRLTHAKHRVIISGIIMIICVYLKYNTKPMY